MIRKLHLPILALVGLSAWLSLPAQEKKAPKPLKALLICGGCCHDYAKQSVLLRDGIQARANVQVDVIVSEDRSTKPSFPLYQSPDWHKGYDVIIHDECAADVKDLAVVDNVVNAHKTVPAVNLHCAMHSFRTGTDVWFKYLGLQSSGHGPQEPIDIQFTDGAHPITETLSDWTTGKEELYNNLKVLDGKPLAMGEQVVKNKDGSSRTDKAIVAWTNETQGARTFSTTLGHNNSTVEDARYLDLVTRGLLWSVDKLNADYLTPYTGPAGKTTTLPAQPKEDKAKDNASDKKQSATMAPPAKDGAPVVGTASSEEAAKGNFAWRALDGDMETRWCASGASLPQWLQLDLQKNHKVTGLSVAWENQGGRYQHKVEGSTDGKSWSVLVDASQHDKGGNAEHIFEPKEVRYVKITVTGTHGGWASIREVSLKGDGLQALAPKLSESQKATSNVATKADPYGSEGNIPPKIVKLTPEQEAAILKDVTVPEGFEVTLFANSAAANYPVYVAAAPNGDLYVASDGNGSLGRNPKRGRIVRLRDTDGDGRADQVTEFVKDIDSPRGLVWDKDRLYLVHPPHLSVHIDKDGDGVAEESKVLVKDIAFGFKDRPADHTTNGLSLGMDGWLYIAGGDFGFMKATGTDGKTLQHRNGGVIRVRPDGTGLEIYATGTRNILEVAISPTMDMFARDNTNDGGGWNVRFHHFPGLTDHGYPRLYVNFPEETVTPLADYGGGSGCGAVYIDEPGFGRWNNAPFTVDWGTNALWHHEVKPKGATFEETRKPEQFIKMTRPTDADVDANSNVYLASWKGATFNWNGPDVGYIVRVRPKGFRPAPLPDFAKASDAELVKLLESDSYRRRMEAQRELMSRKFPGEALTEAARLINDPKAPAAARLAAREGLQVLDNARLAEFGEIEARLGLPAKGDNVDADLPAVAAALALGKPESLKNPRAMVEVNKLLTETKTLSDERAEPLYAITLGHGDPMVQHTAIQSLAKRQSVPLSLRLLDASNLSEQVRINTLHALAKIHSPEAVSGLIERLGKTTDPALRRGILAALCRLYHVDGEWKGDSWGTRPDTRGPYYQPETWAETPKVTAALKAALEKGTPEETAFLVKEMNRNRIKSNDALERILTLAKADARLIPDAVSQLAQAESIPADGIPLLIAAARRPAEDESIAPAVRGQAITALTKTDSAEGWPAILDGLVNLRKVSASAPGVQKARESAEKAFLDSAKLENHHQFVEAESAKVDSPTAYWATSALLNLSARKSGSPEAREEAAKKLDQNWADPKLRVLILRAVADLKHNPYADKVLAALDDGDKNVVKAAEHAVKAMKLEKKTAASGPLVSTLQPAEAIAMVLKTKGDVGLGEQVFARATCVACHTVKEDEAQKGPYLGNIAQTYNREQLAESILDPNKSIAQGFATNLIVTSKGDSQMGFVTFESAEKVTIRNIAAQEFTFDTKDIIQREKPPISMMPPGLANSLTMREFASLLDYLESLSKKEGK